MKIIFICNLLQVGYNHITIKQTIVNSRHFLHIITLTENRPDGRIIS